MVGLFPVRLLALGFLAVGGELGDEPEPRQGAPCLVFGVLVRAGTGRRARTVGRRDGVLFLGCGVEFGLRPDTDEGGWLLLE